MNSLALAFVLLVSLYGALAFDFSIFNRCPLFCAQSSCPMGSCLGCQPGYCASLTRSGRNQIFVCVPRDRCPRGKFCNQAGIYSICQPCNISRCRECESRTVCKRCDYGYEVQDGDCVRRRYG